MQGRPALVVRLVHRGALLHQKAHHLEVLVDTGLGGGVGAGPSALAHPDPTRQSGGGPLGRSRGPAAVKLKEATPLALGQALKGSSPESGGLSDHPAVGSTPGLPTVSRAGHRSSVETTGTGGPTLCKPELDREESGASHAHAGILVRVTCPTVTADRRGFREGPKGRGPVLLPQTQQVRPRNPPWPFSCPEGPLRAE